MKKQKHKTWVEEQKYWLSKNSEASTCHTAAFEKLDSLSMTQARVVMDYCRDKAKACVPKHVRQKWEREHSDCIRQEAAAKRIYRSKLKVLRLLLPSTLRRYCDDIDGQRL